MSNYSQTTFFTPKDSLPTTDPNKTIFGSAYDTEFGNISTAIATKFDSSNGVGVIGFLASNNVWTGTNTFNKNVTIGPPVSGVPLTVNGAAGADSSPISMTGRGFTTNLSFDASGSFFDFAGAQNFRLNTSGTQRVSVNSTGNVTIATPSSGTALTANGLGGANTMILGSTGAASSMNMAWNVLLGASSWSMFTQSTDPLHIGSFGAAEAAIYTNNSARVVVSSAGNVTISAPSSGTAFTVSGFAGAPAGILLNAPNSVSVGIRIIDPGINGTDLRLNTNNSGSVIQTNGTSSSLTLQTTSGLFTLGNAGNITINAPSSGIALLVNQFSTTSGLKVTNGTDDFQVNTSGGSVIIGPSSNSSLALQANGLARLTITTGGQVQISAPSAGLAALLVTAVSGSQPINIQGGGAGDAAFSFNSTNWSGTGTGTPTFANNKPTASTSTATWLKIIINGTTHYIPCWT